MDKIKAYEELLNRTLDSLRVATYYDHANRRERLGIGGVKYE